MYRSKCHILRLRGDYWMGRIKDVLNRSILFKIKLILVTFFSGLFHFILLLPKIVIKLLLGIVAIVAKLVKNIVRAILNLVKKIGHGIVNIVKCVIDAIIKFIRWIFHCEKKEVTRLDPRTVPKFVNQLEKPAVFHPKVVKKQINLYHCKISHKYTVDARAMKQQLLPNGFKKTKVYGYGGWARTAAGKRIKYVKSYPGPTFEANRGVSVEVKWRNKLREKHMFAVDPTLCWANPNNMPASPAKPWPKFPEGFKKAQKPIPIVTHLHGGEVQSDSDGHPDAWFTYNGKKGKTFRSRVYHYPNQQESATLWYHDHTMGMTRLNVYAGLAGLYILRDGCGAENQSYVPEKNMNLPTGKYEMPLVLQDRSFYSDGSMYFNEVGTNPDVHPYWVPGMVGDCILVNGKVWPNMNVERRQYRFRILNGSNDRFYHMRLSNGLCFIQIATDGGYLNHPVLLKSLLIAPGERADILVDFSELQPGSSVCFLNDAPAPFPFGTMTDPETDGLIMQFTIPPYASKAVPPKELPERMNCIPRLEQNMPFRYLTMVDEPGNIGPIHMMLNGQMWDDPVTETPIVGSTEDWCLINLTAGAHPIHVHLIQYQLLYRQHFDAECYKKEWELINGGLPIHGTPKELYIKDYLIGEPIPPEDNELGWKDTIKVYDGQIARIRIRFAPQNIPECGVKIGENTFPFDPITGPGYVWHCHLLDHEDNEMMRPMKVKKFR